jgi:glycosyltransferase involved in cell wall biosynthesis
MKVLALLTDAYGGFGGIAQYNRDLLDALSASSCVEKIISITRHAPDPGYELAEKVVEHVVSGHPLLYGQKAAAIALRVRPDVILCGHFNLLPVAVTLKRLTKAPIMLEAHGIEAWERETSTRSWCIQQADLVLAVSRYTRERIRQWAGLAPHRVRVLTNAVHLDRYQHTSKPDYLVKRYGLEGKRVLMTLSRLPSQERYKGQRKILSLLPDLITEFPDLVYLIVGDGDDRPKLEELVKESGHQQWVCFAGRIPEGEKLDHYNVADAFAMPSLREGFGFVFLEAAACGLPVLGGSKDGSRDALVDGRLGVIVDPEDQDDLFRGLVQILKSEKRVPDCLGPFDFSRFQMQVEDLLVSAARVA